MTKLVRDLKVGDIIAGIETTTFTEPHTVIRVEAYRWDGEVVPFCAITENGGMFDFNTMGHHSVRLAS